MLIRRATPDDLPEVNTCARQAYSPYIAAIGREPAPMVADFRAQIAQGHVHVAHGADGAFSGFIVFYLMAPELFLENVAVVDTARGKGVGRALISHCEDVARDHGAKSVSLYTNAKMTQNLRLYPKLGYIETGRRVENGFDRVYFEKTLT